MENTKKTDEKSAKDKTDSSNDSVLSKLNESSGNTEERQENSAENSDKGPAIVDLCNSSESSSKD